MCLNKIFSFHKQYSKRCRNFYSSSIAGLFTGVMIGILFSLLTDAKFNRWIDIFSFEIFAAIIYFGLTLFVLWIFYWVGKGVFWIILYSFKISNKKDDLIGFKINFLAGVYSAAFSSSLIILNSNLKIMLCVALGFVLMYFPWEYYAVRNKKK